MPNIVPFDKVVTTVIYSFDIQSIEINLFNSAKIRVTLLNEQGNIVDVSIVLLEGDDYTNWGNDDNYIINFVANDLGFTIVY
jgi:hypothetical protein